MIKDASLVLAEYLSLFRDLFNAIVIKGTQILLIEVQNDVYLARTRKNFKSPKMNDRIDDLMIILSVLKVFVGAQFGSILHEIALSIRKMEPSTHC